MLQKSSKNGLNANYCTTSFQLKRNAITNAHHKIETKKNNIVQRIVSNANKQQKYYGNFNG